jgi:hypothetical protein
MPCVDTGMRWAEDVRTFIPNFPPRFHDKFFYALRAIVSVSQVYKLLANATVNLKVISQDLSSSKWIPL